MPTKRLVVTLESGREGLAARLGGDVIFEISYNKSGAHNTTWKPNPSKPIEFYLGELGNFLEHLVTANYRPIPAKVFPLGIMHVWSPDGDYDFLPLEDLRGAKPKFLSSPHLNSTYFLRINTLHADFGIQNLHESEANKGKRWPFEPWNSESGQLYLITNDPELCAAVSGLISRTSRFNVSAEQIMPAIRGAYTR